MCPFGLPGRRTLTHLSPRASSAWEITGSTVGPPVIGRVALTVITGSEPPIALERARVSWLTIASG